MKNCPIHVAEHSGQWVLVLITGIIHGSQSYKFSLHHCKGWVIMQCRTWPQEFGLPMLNMSPEATLHLGQGLPQMTCHIRLTGLCSNPPILLLAYVVYRACCRLPMSCIFFFIEIRTVPVVIRRIIAEDKNITVRGSLLPKKCKHNMQTM